MSAIAAGTLTPVAGEPIPVRGLKLFEDLWLSMAIHGFAWALPSAGNCNTMRKRSGENQA
jgi:hypothetical protein